MTAARILMSLETLDVTGPDADTAARMGFLEWVFANPDCVTCAHVSSALKLPEAQSPESAAAKAFVGFLRQARQGISRPVKRVGRARRLH